MVQRQGNERGGKEADEAETRWTEPLNSSKPSMTNSGMTHPCSAKIILQGQAAPDTQYSARPCQFHLANDHTSFSRFFIPHLQPTLAPRTR